MKTLPPYFSTALMLGVLVTGVANGAPIQFNISTTVTVAADSYDGPYQAGDTITGTFIVDDDKDNGGPGSDPGPGTNEGHEYTSFWEFNGAPYSADLLNEDLGTSFSSGTQAIVVNDGLVLTLADTGGLVPAGTYDWIEILGATTSDYCPLPGGDCSGDPNQILVADGEEWTLAIFATDALGNPDDNWFSGGDIPQNLPTYYSAFLLGFEFDAVGNEVGVVLADVDIMTITAIPVPAAFWLFGSALGGLGWMRRRKAV
jgi:hypothetical protein